MVTLENTLTAFPFGAAVFAQTVAAAGEINQPIGGATVVLSAMGLVGLLARLYVADRQGQRAASSASEAKALAMVNAEKARETAERLRLEKQVEILQQRNDIVIRRSEAAEAKLSLRPCDVLLLEDSDSIASAMVRLLRRADHRVRRTATIAECNAEFDKQPPDVLVFDLRLPDGDGELAFDHAKVAGYPFRAVVVTGDTSDERFERLRTQGVKILVKPIEGEMLLETIRPPLSVQEP